MKRRWLVAACVLMAMVGSVRAANPGNQKVSAKLVADTGKIEAGKPFTVAVVLKIVPGWHVYWKNAGESGLPTTVSLKLPEGFTASAWEYPTPVMFDLGGVQSYGYAKEVTLLATVTPPAKLDGDALGIEGAVKFLVCSEVCLPGNIPLKLELGGDGNAGMIAEVRKLVPHRGTEAVKWNSSVTDDGWTKMQGMVEESGVQWFPDPPEGVLIRNSKVDGKTISFETKKQGGTEVKEKSFESVLGYVDYTTEHGERRGIVMDVPTPP